MNVTCLPASPAAEIIEESETSSTGVIIGVVIGVLLFVAIAIAGVILGLRYFKNRAGGLSKILIKSNKEEDS